MVYALIILKWKKIGLFLHLGVAVFSIFFFSKASFQVLWLMIVIPICALGLLYYVGHPEPKRWAYRLIIFIPLIIILSIGISQGIRISKRVNDHDFGMRIVEGNDLTLVFAPRGPGWPDEGVSWNDAKNNVKYLAEDGYTLMEEEQNIWRLPTVDEMVRLMMLHNVNAGGIWDENTKKAAYEMMPDKETPLWDIHSPVIYYWTSDELESDPSRAYIIVYHGGIFTRVKSESQRYLSFRAVKEND